MNFSFKNPFAKAAAEQTTETATPKPSIHPTEKAFYQGYNGTAEEVAAASQNIYLANGALKAFSEGRPENFQIILAASTLSAKGNIKFGDDNLYGLYYGKRDSFASMSAEQLQLMTAKMSEARGQMVILQLIDAALQHTGKNGPLLSVAGSLIKADIVDKSDLNQLLANACDKGASALVTILHAKGADFNEILFDAKLAGKKELVTNIEAYQEKLTGKPSDKTQALLIELQQQVQDLTAKVENLTSTAVPPAAKVKTVKPE
jgi:hypothetical protein